MARLLDRPCSRRLLSSLALVFCLAGTARAESLFNLRLQSQEDDGVHVLVNAYTLSSRPACAVSPFCYLLDEQIFVSPCPPGTPCVNNVYEFHILYGQSTPELVLDYGVSYQFTGNFERKYAPNISGQCGTYSCVSKETITPASYVTPPRSERSHWAVTFSRANEDTVWANASIESNNLLYVPCTFNPNCHHYSVLLTVFPPVLNIGEIRNGGTYLSLPFIDLPVNIPVALLPNQVYTFDGYFVHHTLNHWCDSVDCSYPEEFEGTEFETRIVATESTTWGKVKSLYRNP